MGIIITDQPRKVDAGDIEEDLDLMNIIFIGIFSCTIKGKDCTVRGGLIIHHCRYEPFYHGSINDAFRRFRPGEIVLLNIRNSFLHITDLCFFGLHHCRNHCIRKDQCKGFK
jgi:hypothetical protein